MRYRRMVVGGVRACPCGHTLVVLHDRCGGAHLRIHVRLRGDALADGEPAPSDDLRAWRRHGLTPLAVLLMHRDDRVRTEVRARGPDGIVELRCEASFALRAAAELRLPVLVAAEAQQMPTDVPDVFHETLEALGLGR